MASNIFAVDELEYIMMMQTLSNETGSQKQELLDLGKRLEQCQSCVTSGWVASQRWPPLAESRYAKAYISAFIRDNNEIPTATPGFWMQENDED